MGAVANSQTTVVRTERGLCVFGTRITLYDVMDYLSAGWPAHVIRDRLQLSDEQIGDVMTYIETHRSELEREYQAVLDTAEENRRYWQERNQEQLARIASSPPKPEQAEVRAKLQAWKAKQGLFILAMVIAATALPSGVVAAEKKPEGVLFSETFDDDALAKRGWYDGTRFRIAGGARAGKGCIEYEWTDGKPNVQGSSPVRRLFEPTDQVAIRYYLKLSKGWGWSGQNYHPHLTHFLTTENTKWHGPAASHLTLYIEPVGGKLRLAAQDIQNADTPHGLTQGPIRGGYNGKFYDSDEVLFNDDQWHCVEAYFKLNTLELANDRPNHDGIVRGWFDGRLVVDRTDVVLRSTDFPKMKFNQFLMAPYFGPGLLPHAQKLWIDELAVGTKRIGPLPTR